MSKEHMTTKESANAFVLSGTIDNMVTEQFIARLLRPGSELTYQDLNLDTLTKRDIACLQHYESKICSKLPNKIVVTDNETILRNNAETYILHLIKKYVFASQRSLDTFEYDIGKLFDDSHYTQHERAFIDRVYQEFLKISETEPCGQAVSERVLMGFNTLYIGFFHHDAKKVFNAILQGTLHAGDTITEWLKKHVEYLHQKNMMLWGSAVYEWFFQIRADESIMLCCDLEVNPTLLYMNFLNMILYDFVHYNAKLMLLKRLHARYGLYRAKDTL